jgi:hypothetical protein
VNFEVGTLVSLATLMMGLLGYVACIIFVYRRREVPWAVDEVQAFGPRLRAKMSDVPVLASVVLLASTLTPWVTGSVEGFPLPGTAWGLPWVRWLVAIPAVAAAVAAWTTPHRRVAGFTLLTGGLFLVCTVIGSVLMELTVLAQSASTLVAHTLLRGTQQVDLLVPLIRSTKQVDLFVPVIRGGIGAPLYTIASLAGAYALALGYRHSATTESADVQDVPCESLQGLKGSQADARFHPGDDWWQ